MDTVELDYATKLVVSLVKSPLYTDTYVNLDRELKYHFNTPKEFSLGAHFSLESFLNDGIAYQFKVINVEPSLSKFLVDNVHTSLVQTELGVKDKWIWAEE